MPQKVQLEDFPYCPSFLTNWCVFSWSGLSSAPRLHTFVGWGAADGNFSYISFIQHILETWWCPDSSPGAHGAWVLLHCSPGSGWQCPTGSSYRISLGCAHSLEMPFGSSVHSVSFHPLALGFSVWQRDLSKVTPRCGKTQYWDPTDCFIILSIETLYFCVGKRCYFIPTSGGEVISRSCDTVAFQKRC